MPLVRIDLPAGKPATYRAGVVEAVQTAMHEALGVPMEEQFRVVTEHTEESLSINRTYLGVERSDEAMLLQITLNTGRDAEKKRAFYKAAVTHLQERVGLRPEDVVISLLEVKRENWSFGKGEAQLI